MRGLLTSVRYTVRLLRKSPGFTITAVLTLGFGIGANTAIFSLIDTVLLTPLPYPEPEKMAVIYMPSESAPDEFFDYPDYLDYVASQHTTEYSLLKFIPADSPDARSGQAVPTNH
jgi:putative ABC transport system permease protein